MKPIHLIAAIDKNRGLGRENSLAWSLPSDMKYFKKITTTTQDPLKQNAVLMGRKTWESIPQKYRPLPNRINVILSKTIAQSSNLDAEVFSDLDLAFKSLNDNPQVESIFVIGGASIYNQTLKQAKFDRIFITDIKQEFKCDSFLDPLPDNYDLEDTSKLISENEIDFEFKLFSRN